MKFKVICTAAVAIFILVVPFFISPTFADPLDNWHLREATTDSSLNSIVYGNGMFVAVGQHGTIISSPDGVNWTARSSGTTSNLRSIAHGNGMFVAVGDYSVDSSNGTRYFGVVLTSVDGIKWEIQSLGLHNVPYSVAYGNGSFVAVGTGISPVSGYGYDISLVSTDGIHWTVNSLPDGLFAVNFLNGEFYAIAWEYTKVYTSLDGVTWGHSTVVSFPNGSCNRLSDIACGNSRFVAVGGACGGCWTGYLCRLTASSSDFVNWNTTQGGLGGSLHSVTYGMGNFVAVGLNVIESSHDGISWRRNLSNSNYSLNAVAHNGSTFIAVGDNGVILQSDQGTQESFPIGVPTINQWGMLLFLIIAGLGAVFILRKQRRIYE